MSEKKSLNKNIDELSIKEALIADMAEIKIRNSVIIDPAPMPFIPITPIVAGKKAINHIKKIAVAIKKSID